MNTVLNSFGYVSIIEPPSGAFPRYELAETGYRNERDKSGYFVLGGFAVANNNGVVLAPSLFLRTYCRYRLSRKSALSWASDIKQWVRFVERVQAGTNDPPYDFDLMAVDQKTFQLYGAFLEQFSVNRRGERLTTATVRDKLLRVSSMHQWFADNGWFYGDIGPGAEIRQKWMCARPLGLLAHIHGRSATRSMTEGPMGSLFARTARGRRAQKLPRALTQQDQNAVANALRAKLDSASNGDPRHDQHLRDELIYNVGRFVGLRVENLAEIPVAKILALRLDGLKDTDKLPIQFVSKNNRLVYPPFPVALLRQMQAYAETARVRAVKVGGGKDPVDLFVAHVGAQTGASIGRRAIQSAMGELFVQAGLSRLEEQRRKQGGEVVRDGVGKPVYRAAANYSVHDLRHTCAATVFYANYAVTRDRNQAMSAVQDQLCHVDINTTEKKYAELTRRFSSWKTFSEGLDKERAVTEMSDVDADEDYQELVE